MKKIDCPNCGKDVEKKLLCYEFDNPVYIIVCPTKDCYISMPIFNEEDAKSEYKKFEELRTPNE